MLTIHALMYSFEHILLLTKNDNNFDTEKC